MTSKIIDKLKHMDAKDVATIEQNACQILEQGPEPMKAEAAAVLIAIDKERIHRAQEERERRAWAVALGTPSPIF